MMLFLKATIKNKKVEGFALFHYRFCFIVGLTHKNSQFIALFGELLKNFVV